MDKRVINCDICSETFVYKYKYEVHYKDVHNRNPYPCVFCNKRFAQKRGLKVHYLCHTNEKPHCCDDCGESFSQISGLKWHRKRKHADEEESNLSFVGSEELGPAEQKSKYCSPSDVVSEEVSSEIPEEKPYKCDKCEKVFLLETALDIHYFNEHPNVKLYLCSECNVNFVDENTLRKHFKAVHPSKEIVCKKKPTVQHTSPVEYRPYKCDKCEKAFFLKRDYDFHYFHEHPNVKLYTCPVCGKSFVHERSLLNHITSHTMIVKGPINRRKRRIPVGPGQMHKCQSCEETFASSVELDVHELSHGRNIDSYTCRVCNKSFSQAEDLGIHLLKHERKNELQTLHICKHCDESFPNKTDLRVHLLSHANELPYLINQSNKTEGTDKMTFSCIECSKEFSSKSEILAHIMSHWQKTCHVCNERFSTKFDLHLHSLSHKKKVKVKVPKVSPVPRKNTCVLCKEQFPTEADLRVHNLSHAKIYTCDVCNETFINSIDFKVHGFSHSDNNPCT